MSITPYPQNLKFPETGDRQDFKWAVMRVYVGECAICKRPVIPIDDLYNDRQRCPGCHSKSYAQMKKLMDEIGIAFPLAHERIPSRVRNALGF